MGGKGRLQFFRLTKMVKDNKEHKQHIMDYYKALFGKGIFSMVAIHPGDWESVERVLTLIW
jgi:hypothetical protein